MDSGSLIPFLQDVCIVQIACGDAHTVALSREGALYSRDPGACRTAASPRI